MKKFVLISCVLGFIFLAVGSVLSLPSVQKVFVTTIRSSGTIRALTDKSQSQPARFPTQLDQIGYLAIFAGIGFFIASFLYNRRSVKSH